MNHRCQTGARSGQPSLRLWVALFLTIPLLLASISISRAGNLIGDDDLGPPAPPKVQGPRIRFDTTDLDWGEVLQGTRVEKTYKFRNVGDGILRLTQIKPG